MAGKNGNWRIPTEKGPQFLAPALWHRGPTPGELLSEEDQSMLAVLSTVVRFKKGQAIYTQGDEAKAVFNLVSGVAKSFKSLPDGSRHVVGFLWPKDIFGLSEQGQYVNSAEAVTPVTAYRIAAPALEQRLRRDPSLNYQVLCRLCMELREAQYHAFILSRHRAALSKLALFFQMLLAHEMAHEQHSDDLRLPMTRGDIADFLGTSSAVVTRALRALADRGIVEILDRHRVRIMDRERLEEVALETGAGPGSRQRRHAR